MEKQEKSDSNNSFVMVPEEKWKVKAHLRLRRTNAVATNTMTITATAMAMYTEVEGSLVGGVKAGLGVSETMGAGVVGATVGEIIGAVV